MKGVFILIALALCTGSVFAQSEEKSTQLGEAVVKAERVVDEIDGQTFYPTEVQRKASFDGYGILQKLSLPGIRVDEAARSVTAIGGEGSVLIRINGIVAGKQEMLSLDPKTISKIRFIDIPGVRYGEGVAYVIDIATRRTDLGFALGADANAALTAVQVDADVYGKWRTGRHELSLSYGAAGYKLEGAQSTEVADYILSDGSVYTIKRNDELTRRKQISHSAKLTYNRADSTAQVFQASLSGSFNKRPGNRSVKSIIDGWDCYTATSTESGRGSSPVADLYYFRQITPRQSITANAVGTYIFTKSYNYYDEGTAIINHVSGKSGSVLSEVIYENKLKPFTLSSGLNYRFKHTKNDYTGTAPAQTQMINSAVYGFAEIKGRHKDLNYSLGAGGSYIHYRQGGHNYDYWTFCPKTTLAYRFKKKYQIKYTFSMRDKMSQIAMVSNAAIRTNRREWTKGNPDLKPRRELEHTLRLSRTEDRWQLFVEGMFRQCLKPNMALYKRTADDLFVYTQINQKEIDLLHTMAYASGWAIQKKLQISIYGGMMRCFNFGNEYTHCRTSFFCAGSVTAYLGKFTLQAGGDSGSRFLEGESKVFNGGYTFLQASYRLKDWQFMATWSNPFYKHYKSYETEILNRYLHKHIVGRNKDLGNRIMLSISWRINRGKEHRAVEKKINLKDIDTGIIK